MNDREPARSGGVLSMPVCASTNGTIQKFSDVPCETGDRHEGTISMREERSVRSE